MTQIAVHRVGDDFFADLPEMGLRFEFVGVSQDSRGLHAEVVVKSTNPALPGELLWENITLSGGTARSGAAKRLNSRWPGGADFDVLLHEVCGKVRDMFRQGEPIEELQPRPRTRARYLVRPMILENQINVWYGDGGTGKGMLALFLAVGLATGRATISDLTPQGRVLYLDWETDREETEDRIHRIARGMGLDAVSGIDYRRCVLPLADDIASILRLTATRDYSLVAVDSMGLAVGGDQNNTPDTVRSLRAARSLHSTVLLIDHSGKGGERGKPIGNSYKYHYARGVWEFRAGDRVNPRDPLEIACFDQKGNNGPKWHPIAFRLNFDGEDGPVTLSRNIRASAISGVAQHLSSATRILDALEEAPLPVNDLWLLMQDIKRETFDRKIRELRTQSKIKDAGGLVSRI